MIVISDKVEIPNFTSTDFLDTLAPYEFIYSLRDNRFLQNQVIQKVAKIAQEQKVRGFIKLYKDYVSEQSGKGFNVGDESTTQFEDQELELFTGKWMADEDGVTCFGSYGEEIHACKHPIMPIERLTNIDTGIEKVKIAFRRRHEKWRTIITDRKTIASQNSIINLADNGISVSSENAKYLVDYLQTLEDRNNLPKKHCVSRLGWIDGQGFSPYVEELVFDGDASFKTYFDSVQKKGDFKIWLKIAKEVRSKNIVTRIILAASFASVLVKPLGLLPFFVHLWGGTEVGKTVGLMLATSVWANPELGHYIHSFNSTAVGRERSAAFVNNLPLIMDELQIIKEKKQFDQDIYMLCEGAGKTRGNKNGGTDKTPTWSNCILTSGEMPITNANSGGGAVNRILEIECKEALFEDPREFCNIVKKNYGHAGKVWVDFLSYETNIEAIQQVFKIYFNKLSDSDTTEKQAMAGALILTVDTFLSKIFFNGDSELRIEDIKPFLQTKKDVSVHQRAYDYMCSWVSQNFNKFHDESMEIYGLIGKGKDFDYAFIINTVFYKACEDAGFNPTAFISYLKTNNLIDAGKNETMKIKRIKGMNTRCLCLKLIDDATV